MVAIVVEPSQVSEVVLYWRDQSSEGYVILKKGYSTLRKLRLGILFHIKPR